MSDNENKECVSQRSDFVTAIQHVINSYSMENGCDTPDFILARYLNECLHAFNYTTQAREKWYGRASGNGEAILGRLR